MIEASAKAGVKELKFRDLHVTFGTPVEQRVIPYPFVPQTAAPVPVKALTDIDHQKLARESLETDEMLTREEQLARAIVEDPEKFEELLRNGDLSDELDGADSGEDE